ncbi:MAG: hypothetical protein CMG41_06865 [Candidatus Marinimicrobia bacterium]|nr:hypothetical protein [Candidatus Neomarinimicrobiota bacterium]
MKIFQIKPEERSPIIILMLMFFCIVGSSITSSSARDTFFLTQFDKSLLPLMFAVVAVFMVGAIMIYNHLASELDLVKVIILSSSFFCFTLVLIRLNLNGIIIPIFYAWTDVIISITIFQFWLLANEIFDARQAKRLFSFIGIGGSIAGISAGYLIRPFVKNYGADDLLIPTIVMIAIIAVFASFLSPYRSKKQIKKSNNKPISNKTVLDPYLKSILVMVCSAAVCSRIIEYQFKITAVNNYESSTELAAFFGEYYMFLNATTLVMQLFLTGYVLNRFGVLGGLIFLPIGLAMGSLSFLILTNLSSIFLARLFDQAFKFSIQSASSEVLWTPVPKQKARRAKPLIDSSIKSVAEGIVGIFIYIIIITKLLPSDKIYLLSAPVVFITVLWLINNFRIKRRYISTIEDAINHRHLNLENVQIDVTDSHIINTIDTALNDADINKQLFAIDLIKNLPLNNWHNTLNKLVIHGRFDVQKKILILSSDKDSFIDNEKIKKLSKGDNEIAALAIMQISDNEIKNLIDSLINNLEHNNAHIKAASAVRILGTKHDDKKAKKVLNDFLDIKDEVTTALALDYLKNSSALLPQNVLYDLLYHPSIQISISALSVAENRLDNYYLPAITSNLDNAKIAQNARSVLKQYNEVDVIKTLEKQLKINASNLSLSKGIVRCLGEYSTEKSVLIIKSLLNHKNYDISIVCSEALLKIAKKQVMHKHFERPFINEIKSLSDQYFRLHFFKILIIDCKGSELIIDQLISEQRKLLQIILKLVTLQIPNSPIDSHIKSIIDNSDADLPYILEFFDTSFEKDIRDILMPIIDPDISFNKKDVKKIQKKNNIGFNLKSWSESDNSWKSVIAIDYILNHNNTIIEKIDWDKVKPSPFLAELFNKSSDFNPLIPITKFKNQSEPTMFSILEKTILLKTVELFQNIPGELLSQISQISRAKNYQQNDFIFNEGDSGDSLFIVLSGEISIKKGDKIIAKLDRGASLGEMALLDHETRSADAFASKDSILLKINQDVFYELMEGNSDIMKQIIKLLTSRIREANSKLEQSLK